MVAGFFVEILALLMDILHMEEKVLLLVDMILLSLQRTVKMEKVMAVEVELVLTIRTIMRMYLPMRELEMGIRALRYCSLLKNKRF